MLAGRLHLPFQGLSRFLTIRDQIIPRLRLRHLPLVLAAVGDETLDQMHLGSDPLWWFLSSIHSAKKGSGEPCE